MRGRNLAEVPGTALLTGQRPGQGHRFTEQAGPIAKARGYADAGTKSRLREGAARSYANAMTNILPPDDCTTMAEVRAGVDAVDRAIGALLGTRFGYMRAAARIKPERGHVRDEPRKAEVIANAVAQAEQEGFPPKIAAALWEQLVEASIAYELEAFDTRRAG